MVLLFVSFIAVFILSLSLFNMRWGAVALLAALILMPDLVIQWNGITIKRNYLMLGVFIIFILHYKIKAHITLDTTPFRFVIIYFSIFLILIVFQWGAPYSAQIHYWLTDLFLTLLIPIFYWNLIRVEDCLNLLNRTILVCIVVATTYGLLLTFLEGINPYVLLFANELRDEDYIKSYMAYSAPGRGRLFGRISSVFYHPMRYAFFLGLSFFYIYLLRLRSKIKKVPYLLFLFLIGSNVLICGVRSLLAALIGALTLSAIMMRNIRYIFIFISFLIISFFVISLTPLSGYIDSIVSPQKSDTEISGSSLDMRLNQLDGALYEIRDNVILGKGYGWNRYYQKNNGDHPVLLAFESLLFVILCNNGLLGFIVWFIYFVIYYKYVNSRFLNLKEKTLFKSIMCFYIIFSFITGEYEYMWFFVLFFTFMLSECGNSPNHLQLTSTIK